MPWSLTCLASLSSNVGCYSPPRCLLFGFWNVKLNPGSVSCYDPWEAVWVIFDRVHQTVSGTQTHTAASVHLWVTEAQALQRSIQSSRPVLEFTAMFHLPVISRMVNCVNFIHVIACAISGGMPACSPSSTEVSPHLNGKKPLKSLCSCHGIVT